MKNWVLMVVFFLGMGAFYPFVHNYILFGSLSILFSMLFMAFWFFILIISKSKYLLPSLDFNIIVFTQCVFLFFSSIVQESSFMPFLYLGLSWITLFLVINTFTTEFFLKKFIILNIVSAFLCVIGTIAVITGYLNLFGIYDYQGTFRIFNFGLFFVKTSATTIGEMRPAGYYDEPGSFAYVVMFLLLINRKFFKNMKWEYSLLILPLVTTSLAHIFTIIIFGVFTYINRNNIKKLLLFLILIGSIFFLINSGLIGEENSSFFRRKSIGRVESVLSGEDKGRQGGLDLGPVIFEKHYLGYSVEKVSANYPGFVNETIWGPLIYYGILGVPFYFLPFFYILIRTVQNRDKEQFFALILVIINLLQRPYYMYPLFIVLLYFLFFEKGVTGKSNYTALEKH
jgi:hypothetical protein